MKNMMRWTVASIVLAMAAMACSSSDSDSDGAAGAAGTAGGAGAVDDGGSGGNGGTDSEGGADAGDDSTTDETPSACVACLETNCSDELEACDGQAECQAAYGAFKTCLDTDALADCAISFAIDATDTGSSQANDVAQCGDTNCATECAGGATDDDAGTDAATDDDAASDDDAAAADDAAAE